MNKTYGNDDDGNDVAQPQTARRNLISRTFLTKQTSDAFC